MEERLQKIIARAGIASRRRAEEMMASGLVTVNGRTITELGTKADVSRDHIKVAGKLIRTEPGRVYLVLNKPAEVVATLSDPEGRRSLRELLHGVSERVFPTGRMEYHASGLILLTNDGDLTNRILRAHDLRQVWHVKLKALLTFAEIETLARVTGARITRLRGKDSPWYEVTLAEARRDALRNKLMHMGNPVEKMRRVAIGNVELGAVPPGGHRELTQAEVTGLTRMLDGGPVARSPGASSPPKRRKPSMRQKKKK
ncbi:MAG TPA: S4 domain-containing protein [Candidatus Acidoferrales bacterium]